MEENLRKKNRFMLKLFRLIFEKNIISVWVLFFVLFLASTSFLVIRELTTNIERTVAEKVQPLFGTDIKISPKNYTSRSLSEIITPYLSGSDVALTEREEFLTTLMDGSGKTGLIKVVTYTGKYPQKWILDTEKIWSFRDEFTIAATPELISRFESGGIVSLDGYDLSITDRIRESSDLGFSLGSENYLLILPRSLLSGSLLLSSGSRLEQSLYIEYTDHGKIESEAKRLKSLEELREYRIQSYNEQSTRTLSTTDELSNYILLILIVAVIFSSIILRSAHDRLFEELSRTLRIMEILGLSKKRQIWLFMIFYSFIIPLSFCISVWVAFGIIHLIAQFPGAEGFMFSIPPVFFSLIIFIILTIISFLPAWNEKASYKIQNRFSRIQKYITSDNSTSLLGISGIIFLIFEDITQTFLIIWGWVLGFLLLYFFLDQFYKKIFLFIKGKSISFITYDSIRTLVRPMIPTLSISLSLIWISLFLIVFSLFSFSFRERLLVDTSDTANIYAINILEQDRDQIVPYLSGADTYSILRARISDINGQALSEHLKNPNPTGEFTREFNITTDILRNRIIEGKENLAADEVSVDKDFAKRLWVNLWDSIGFLLSGKKITLRVANIRESVRDGFRPFFYFSFQEEAFQKAPKTYFVSAYRSDPEVWKSDILKATGPHVTFIDIESILVIARDIAGKILSIISLFFGVIWLFGILAILSLFQRFEPIERIKSRLYSLFWVSLEDIMSLFRKSRGVIFLVSYSFSLIWGYSLYLYLLTRNSLLEVSIIGMMITPLLLGLLYGILFLAQSPRISTR